MDQTSLKLDTPPSFFFRQTEKMQELVFNALDTNNSGTISFRFSIENALVPFPRCQGVVAGRVHLPEGNPRREARLDFQALRHGWQWQH